MNETPMDALERSARLRREADVVLETVRLFDILQPHGRIVPIGSYYLDVMMYPDIDVYLSRVSLETLFAIGAQLAACDRVYQVVFEKSDTERLPGGLYLKPRIAYGEWGRPWKIDIWSLDDALIDQTMADLVRFKRAITAEVRERILRFKFSILTASGRTPMYSGYWICQAFIDEGLTDFGDVTQYLIEHGIEMPQGVHARTSSTTEEK